jgi:hypothetical protein
MRSQSFSLEYTIPVIFSGTSDSGNRGLPALEKIAGQAGSAAGL